MLVIRRIPKVLLRPLFRRSPTLSQCWKTAPSFPIFQKPAPLCTDSTLNILDVRESDEARRVTDMVEGLASSDPQARMDAATSISDLLMSAQPIQTDSLCSLHVLPHEAAARVCWVRLSDDNAASNKTAVSDADFVERAPSFSEDDYAVEASLAFGEIDLDSISKVGQRLQQSGASRIGAVHVLALDSLPSPALTLFTQFLSAIRYPPGFSRNCGHGRVQVSGRSAFESWGRGQPARPCGVHVSPIRRGAVH